MREEKLDDTCPSNINWQTTLVTSHGAEYVWVVPSSPVLKASCGLQNYFTCGLEAIVLLQKVLI